MDRQRTSPLTAVFAALAVSALLGACSDGNNIANGINGNSGLSTLFATAASSNCTAGGVRLDFGLDDDRDGILDPLEIDGSTDVCNGASGATGSGGSNGLAMLFKTSNEAAGVNCSTGGIKLESGLDTSGNGVLENGEVSSATYICNGNTGVTGSDGVAMLYQATAEAAGSNCTYGGYRFVSWRDTIVNSTLDPAEVATSTTSFVCNGSTGATGSTGANGIAMRFSSSAEPAGVNCASGGTKIDSWLDANGDGLLNGTEAISDTAYLCNGSTGATGSNGASMLFLSTAEPAGLNCLNGGTRIDMGLDDIAVNGLLDVPAEIDATSYICNGVDATVSGTTLNNGSVLMGAVKGAKVCADLNANGQCDLGEPFSYSSSVPGLEGKFIVRGIPAGQSYQLITEGGIDSLTGRPALPLMAPKDAVNITPITTLVATSSNPTALAAVLDDLSGGVGYDVNFTTTPVSSALLALNKSLEAFVSSMAGVGLSKPVEQSALLNLVAQQMVTTPPSATVALSDIFALVAANVAQNPAQLNPSDPPLLSVSPGNYATFSSQVSTQVAGVEAAVKSFGTAVQETQALQTAVDNVAPPVLPVGTVTVSVGTVSVYDAANQLVTNLGASGTLPSASFKKVAVALSGTNSYAPSADQSYTDASFTLTVADKSSERSFKLTVAGLTVTVAANGAVSVATTAASTLALEGRNTDGNVVVTTQPQTGFANPIIAGNVVTFDIPALETQLGGGIAAKGDFTISAAALGVPGVPKAVALTLN